jgi:hypothetical protein
MQAKGLPTGQDPEAQARWDAMRAEVGPSRLSRHTAYLALGAYLEDYGPGWPNAPLRQPLSDLNRGVWRDGDTADPAARFDWYQAVLRAVSGKPPNIPPVSDDAGPEQTADEWLDVLELFLQAIWKRAGDVPLADVLSWIRDPHAPVSSIGTTPWELWSFPWPVSEIESVRRGQLLHKPNG